MADPVPDSLPPFVSEVHSREPLPIHSEQPMYTGVRRRRRISSAVKKPAYISIEWDLSQEQMAIMHDWYENTLLAGTLSFLADVAALGPGLDAAVELLWFEPPVATPNDIGRWRVTGKCLLDGVAPVPTFTASGAAQPIYPKRRGHHLQADGIEFPGGGGNGLWQVPEPGNQLAWPSTPSTFITWADGLNGTDDTLQWTWESNYFYLQFLNDTVYEMDWVPATPDDWAPDIHLDSGNVYRFSAQGSLFFWGGGVLTMRGAGNNKATVLTFTEDVAKQYTHIAWEYVLE